MSDSWTQPLGVLGAAVAGALLAAWVSAALAGRVAGTSRRPLVAETYRRCRRPWTAALLSIGLLVALPAAHVPAPAAAAVAHAVTIATIAAVSWLASGLLFLVEDAVLRRIRVDVRDNRRARQVRTQLTALRRLSAVIVTVIAMAAILMTFGRLRAYGASVLASAGVAGVVAGLAAQTTLSNVFAGMQLVFTDALRIDDVVVVDDEWGRVEDLTLTYVVVHLWDERRLVLPATYFTTTPFQNWTRSESRMLGAVVLYLSPETPLAALRERAREVVEANPLWDRRDWVLQVVDMTELTLVVRVLASAADAPSAWDLRCDIREQLVCWLQEHHPASLARGVRVQPEMTLADARV